MDMYFSMDLFIYAIEKNTENEIWETWKLQYSKMNTEDFISYENYKKQIITKQHTEKTYEEIEIEMAKVEQAFAERS